MSARQDCRITAHSMEDRCDFCGQDLGRGDTKFTTDDWDTVGCCWDHAEISARHRRG